jgi:hypothetical protein
MNITQVDSHARTKALFDGLRQLKRDCSPTSTKDELAMILIKACIYDGLDTGPRIVGALATLGLNKKHAGIVLSRWVGNDPERYHWQRNADGRYSVHDEPTLA